MKEKSPALRIHVIGFGGKEEELKPLTCLAGATGGTFVSASEAECVEGWPRQGLRRRPQPGPTLGANRRGR